MLDDAVGSPHHGDLLTRESVVTAEGGVGAAAAANLQFGNDAEYRAVSYGQPAPTDIARRDAFVVDFS